MTFEFTKPSNPYGGISDVATKLGVEPCRNKTVTITMKGHDGQDYDVWEVLVALLDRMDRAAS